MESLFGEKMCSAAEYVSLSVTIKMVEKPNQLTL